MGDLLLRIASLEKRPLMEVWILAWYDPHWAIFTIVNEKVEQRFQIIKIIELSFQDESCIMCFTFNGMYCCNLNL